MLAPKVAESPLVMVEDDMVLIVDGAEPPSSVDGVPVGKIKSEAPLLKPGVELVATSVRPARAVVEALDSNVPDVVNADPMLLPAAPMSCVGEIERLVISENIETDGVVDGSCPS